ncbi:Atu2307/SP_0267 family LLM class monooxygenase [Brevibacillus gelatini]|uniref:Atu2307/SP_0267 family LLM class monooxygenase n=1 Tax=Brevibacillus TaxID=55080 RepID=UPI0036455A9F
MTESIDFELGINTFLETSPDPVTGKRISHPERIRNGIEEIVVADQAGLDVFGIGEHQRFDFASEAPAVILAAAAALTKRIRLTSAVTVLSSDDPVRVYQSFSTLDSISNGRAEIMVGRGAFVDSFPLFGYDLKDYDELFEEHLELLLKVRASEKVTWRGGHRPAIHNLGVYPRSVQDPLPVWIGSGGRPDSAIRAGALGLPIVFAIIGGNPERFAPLAELYKQAAASAGHDVSKLKIATHSHGFVSETTEEAVRLHRPYQVVQMNELGRVLGWAPYTEASYELNRKMDGSLYVGDPEYVAEKILHVRKMLGTNRFFLHLNIGTMPHREVLRAIELFGTRVAPIVRKEIAKENKQTNA